MDLRYRTKEVLRALEANEEITLTHRGKEKGRIVPAVKGRSSRQDISQHEAIGMWANQKESVPEMITRIRKPRSC